MIKTFSVKDGSLLIIGDTISLNENSALVATNNKLLAASLNNMVYLLPTSLIRTPKSDDELAEEYVDKVWSVYKDDEVKNYGVDRTLGEISSSDFLAGRKSFGDKEFHLTREELKTLLTAAAVWVASFDDIISTIIHPTFPHTITVEQNEDGSYNWGGLKCKY